MGARKKGPDEFAGVGPATQADKSELLSAILGPGSKVGAAAGMLPEVMIQNLQDGGYRIVKDDPLAESRTHRVEAFRKARWEGGDVVRFGVVSCTHLGSRQQQLSALEAFYDRVAADGITEVFHAGDVVDGDGRVYKGHEFDVFVHGADRQRGYAVDFYPRRDGVRTTMIAGNHDWSFWQRGGVDILEAVARERSDIEYLGPMGAKVMAGGVHVYLSHGAGGVAYARSYKMQRRIEQFAPQEKPEVYLIGHFHSWAHLPMYRNVEAWTIGCFQSQTDYLKRLGLYPEIGGLLWTVYRGTAGADRPGGFVRVVSEVIPFFAPVGDDF